MKIERVKNSDGATQCVVRYMVETEAGWIGAWDEAAIKAYRKAVLMEAAEVADNMGMGEVRNAILFLGLADE